MRLFAFGFFLLSFFFTSKLFASDLGDTTKVNQLSHVDIFSYHKPSVLLSTSPLQLFSKTDILNQGIQSLSDALRRFDGVVLKDYGGIGGLKTISIRGMGAEHTAISYDGIMINNMQSGQVDLSQFSLDNISMISLNVGQSDDIFQTARAFASVGVLNLQTLIPHFNDKNYKAEVKVSVGSFGLFNPMVNYAQRLGSKNVLTVNTGWQRADGNYPFTMKNIAQIYKAKRHNSDVDICHTEVNLFTKFNDSSTLNSKVFFWNSERGLPGSVDFYESYSGERLWDKNFFVQSSYNLKFDKNFKFKSQLKYNYSYTRYVNISNMFMNGISIDKYRQQELYWSNTLLYAIRHFRFSFAQDLFYDKLNVFSSISNITAGAYPRRFNSLSVLAGQYKINRLTVNASLLNTYVKEDVKDKDVHNCYKRLSPSIGISFTPLSSYKAFKIRALYKDIFRLPTFTEVYYTDNLSKIRPEKATQYNLGFTWVGAQSNNVNNYLSVSTDFYYNRVADKIIIQPSTFFSHTINLGSVDIKGIDFKLDGGMELMKELSFNVTASYSYMSALDVTDPTSLSYNNQIMYTPKHSGSVVLSLLSKKWINLSYTILFMGERYFSYTNTPEYYLDGYTDHSISVNRAFKIENCNLNAQFTISNLFNHNYQIIHAYPMAGRSFNFSISCKF